MKNNFYETILNFFNKDNTGAMPDNLSENSDINSDGDYDDNSYIDDVFNLPKISLGTSYKHWF
jgi:hypothetical protein